jgi:short-subunit dehydrogenase
MSKETVLITGASSGIGLELARLFAADGADLVLLARRETRLQELAEELRRAHGAMVGVVAGDLADPGVPGDLAEDLAEKGIEIDVLVNNAGFGARGPVGDIDLDRQLAMLQVNVTALTHLTRLFLPAMQARGRGGVLNVGSTAAFQPGPHMAVYYATKAYVLSFTEALAEELRGSGLKVSCLCPGATETGFAAEADMADTSLFKHGAMDVMPVVRAGYEGFRRGKVIVVPGLKNKLTKTAVRFVPRSAVRRAVASLQERKPG